MQKKLTDRLLKTLKPDANRRIEIRDSLRVGLCFRLSPAGNASWIVQKKIKGGKRRGPKIGNYPQMSLSEARFEALKLESEASQGIDRIAQAEEAIALETARLKSQMLISELLDKYITKHIRVFLKSGPSQREREQQLRNSLGPYFDQPTSDLSRHLLQKIIDDKREAGKMVMANRLRAALSAFTNWSYRRQYIDEMIGVGLERPKKEQSRQRTPTLSEVQEIWTHSFELGPLWGPFVRMCILTGQRSRTDVLALRWSWVDLERMRYEVPNPKNKSAHIVSLSRQAVQELETLRKKVTISNCDFVFSTTGTSPSSGVTKAKKRLDALINSDRKLRGVEDMEHWVLHDFRRSQATSLVEAEYDEGVVDRIQNHTATGSRPSIVSAVYNKAHKLDARSKAVQAWADMVTGSTGNVVPFSRRSVL